MKGHIIMYDEHLLKLPNMTDEEKKFIKDVSEKHDHEGTSLPKVISEMYLAKKIELMVDKTIESNEKYATAMKWLTVGLIIATLVNAAVLIFK